MFREEERSPGPISGRAFNLWIPSIYIYSGYYSFISLFSNPFSDSYLSFAIHSSNLYFSFVNLAYVFNSIIVNSMLAESNSCWSIVWEWVSSIFKSICAILTNPFNKLSLASKSRSSSLMLLSFHIHYGKWYLCPWCSLLCGSLLGLSY